MDRNVSDAEALLKTGAILSRLSENKPNIECCSKAFGRVCKIVSQIKDFLNIAQILHSDRINLSPFTKDFRV